MKAKEEPTEEKPTLYHRFLSLLIGPITIEGAEEGEWGVPLNLRGSIYFFAIPIIVLAIVFGLKSLF